MAVVRDETIRRGRSLGCLFFPVFRYPLVIGRISVLSIFVLYRVSLYEEWGFELRWRVYSYAQILDEMATGWIKWESGIGTEAGRTEGRSEERKDDCV